MNDEQMSPKRWSGKKLAIVIAVVGCGGGLAGLVILGLAATFLVPNIVEKLGAAEAELCRGNLERCYEAQIRYRAKWDRWPQESGVAFLAAPFAAGAVEPTHENALALTCPGVAREILTIGELPWPEWWTDLERIDGSWSAYAGRNMERFPLHGLSASEPVAACDNDGGRNHLDATHVLYADGSIRTLSLEQLKREGILNGDETVLTVGPDSPIEDLRKLSLD
jgi:hypothetical protein